MKESEKSRTQRLDAIMFIDAGFEKALKKNWNYITVLKNILFKVQGMKLSKSNMKFLEGYFEGCHDMFLNMRTNFKTFEVPGYYTTKEYME